MGEVGGLGGGGEGVAEVDLECLEAVEKASKEVLACIHPTLDSEEKRKDVIDFVQKLFRDHLGCQVFPYGSVPLKTYLPDGDIDLTVIHPPHVDNHLPREVLAILQQEELNEKNAEYKVKDTQFIDAEVKLVKCLVQNIVVDISFHQIGGLSTLCFLEQVDRLTGKDHLFKRSILLVKSWCYYESRILGAHHGLISTYALETLVLYVFHVFHSSLNDPLMVLYKFLDFYGKFDWDKFCISLDGPVRKSTLPDIVVVNSENEDNDLMLSEEFLRYCTEMFSVPSSDQTLKVFPTKHLNIIDPLKQYNNLGRSVHRGNYYRIRSAFKHGALKLGKILSLPSERVADEIKRFFANTLERHGCKCGDYMPKPVLAFGADWSVNLSGSSSDDMLFEVDTLTGSSAGDFEEDAIGVEEKCTSMHSNEVIFSRIGDGNDQLHSNSHSGEGESRLMFSSTENVSRKYGSSCQTDSRDGINSDAYEFLVDKLPDICTKGLATLSPKTDISGKLLLDLKLRDFASLAREVEPLNPPADLTGDYDSHLRSFLYGQSFNGLPLSERGMSYTPPSPSRFRSENPWDTVCQSRPLRLNSFPRNKSNFVYTGSSLDVASSWSPSGVSVSNRHKCKSRGTGTFIPIKQSHHGERFQVDKERTESPKNSFQLQRNSDKIVQSSGLSENNPSLGSSPVAVSNYSQRNCTNCSLSPQMKTLKPVQGQKIGRVEEQSFNLKNDDFPALSV